MDKGIRVGMTSKELKGKYYVDEVDLGGDTGVQIFKGFEGSFGVETPKTNGGKLRKKILRTVYIITDTVDTLAAQQVSQIY